jgi:hypothetical protein
MGPRSISAVVLQSAALRDHHNGLRRERSLFCLASRTMGGGTPWVHETLM